MASIRMTHGAQERVDLRARDKLAGVIGFTVAVAMLRCLPFRANLAVARGMKLVRRTPATQADAERAVAARNWAIRYFPGRAACLENSLAAFIVVVLQGRAVDWCIGCRFLPAESHTWIQIDSGPAGEPDLSDRPFHVTVLV